MDWLFEREKKDKVKKRKTIDMERRNKRQVIDRTHPHLRQFHEVTNVEQSKRTTIKQ